MVKVNKYRKKPVIIEAIQLNASLYQDVIHSNISDLITFSQGAVTVDMFGPIVKTLEGYMRISPGDYLIKGIQGEYYPCKPDIFEQTYEIEEG